MKIFVIFSLLLWVTLKVYCQDLIDSYRIAADYFNEIKEICEKDNGRLWGKSLYGPILFIEKSTRNIIANQPDNDGLLKKKYNLYSGKFPLEKNIANSTVEFGGIQWTMVIWPLPEDRRERNLLIIHESFHRIQDELGLNPYGYDNSHLEKKDARIFMQLEWLALEKAIDSKDDELKIAIHDALVFRKYRQSLYPAYKESETKFEIHEGMAEYTGITLAFSNNKKLIKKLDKKTAEIKNSTSYFRTFAYCSGPLYGYLLDLSGMNWRQNLSKESDLGELLAKAYSIDRIEKMDSNTVVIYGKKYSYEKIEKKETERELAVQKIVTEYKNKFTRGPILKINLIKMNIGFDPSNLLSLDTLGTVYRSLRLTDEWGILIVHDGGALLSKGWDYLLIPAQDMKQVDAKVMGDGWELFLKENWNLVKNKDVSTLEKLE
jgi:hypothetical protein